MERLSQGKYVTTSAAGEKVRAFVPVALPPKPDVKWDAQLRGQFEDAYLALGRLDSLSNLLPEANLFLYAYVRKEAVLSSMIEGTQSSLSDLLMHEMEQAPGVPIDDVTEVSNYVAALNHGLRRLQQDFPISGRLIREIHEILLSSGRGSHKQPGEFRRSQNWIGGTRPGNAVFIPPPAEYLGDGISALERFIHDETQETPAVLKAALVHAQFETLHPFLDGNGRVGRLLITLILVSQGILQQPLLYISLFFKLHRQIYYQLLNQVRLTGDWESWLGFFAEAVAYTANSAVDTAKQLMAKAEQDAARLNEQGRTVGSLRKLHQALQMRPIATAGWLQKETSMAPATIQAALQKLENMGLLEELTGKKRNRAYAYKDYIEILSQGNEMP